MNIHGWLDVIGQRNMWRRRRPPVESGRDEAERLLSRRPEELHPPVGPAEFRWGNSRTSGDVLQEHFTFPSPVPAGDDAVDTVHCVRWRRRDTGPDRPGHTAPGFKSAPPRSRRDRPGPVGMVAGRRCALVLVHGAFAGSHRKSLAFVPPVGTSDWDTVAIELPHHMRRQCARSEYSGQFMVTADLPRLVRGMHQGEADIRALVRGLREMGYERIVAGGLSLGANVLLQAIMRVPVDGAFLVVPSVDAYASLWESVLGQCLRPAGHAAGFTDELARRVLRLITPLHMGRPATATDRLLFVYGLHDLLCPRGPVEELCRAWDGSRSRALDAGHATLVLRCRNVRRIAAAWMKAVCNRR